MDYNDADDLRKLQADTAEDAPPLADTADPGHAERMARLRERAETAQARGFCEAMNPDGLVKCSLSKGHSRPTDTEGEEYDHAAPSLGVWWSERVAAPVQCDARPELFGWATRDTRCTLAAGHVGDHADGPQRWGLTPDNDGDAIRALIDRALASGKVKVWSNAGDAGACRKAPATAVRVRFIDLPPRHTELYGPLGTPMHVAAPGGFALVVDRFRDAQHCRDERARWDEFGASIGAKVVLCYPGELDIVDYLAD